MNPHLKTSRILAKLLDSQFSFLGIKFGLDPVMDIIPALGDIAGLLFSLYILWVGLKLDLPGKKIILMIRNIIIDFLLGLLPIAGPIADVFYKSNKMNLEIIEKFHSKIVEGQIIK